MKAESIKYMDRSEIKDYLFCIQDYFKNSIDNGADIDDILDNTMILDEFEDYLPEEEFPIFVITVLNGFKTESIIEKILDSIEKKRALNVSN
tara:strand:+ start:264 stop:539 length:276 start_codon:yes stop_codon:yes gene_type:complete